MNPSPRKQREIEQREELILRVARRILLDRGYLGMSMDRVAEATEYSKGTIYQHFRSKEDLLSGLATQTLQARLERFRRAATFKGRPRERFFAIGLAEELFVELYPEHFRSEQIITASSVQGKASNTRLQAMLACNMGCKEVCTGVVRDAIACGDLPLPDGRSPEEMAFVAWAMYSGAFSIIHSGIPIELLGLDDPAASLHANAQLWLDGYGWQPLSTEWDYDSTRKRILEEIFADDLQALAAS